MSILPRERRGMSLFCSVVRDKSPEGAGREVERV